ncbi:hypothetical protein ABBQ32_009538 [Trebouxia sp. C0010 RCD-2024]
MADDDLDMLQQLLEMAEDDKDDEASEGRAERETFMSGPPDQENFPANKRPKLAETAKPLAAGKSRSATKCPVNSNAHLPAAQTKTGAVEKFSGMRVRAYETEMPVPQVHVQKTDRLMQMRNPCLPSIVLKERLSHVCFEKLSQIRPFDFWKALTSRGRVGADAKWATIAVVTEKSTKESAKGNAYGIWRLSDLQGANVSLFLFGKAQTGLWKETEGSVVAIFNPEARIAEGKLSMSVDSEQQVVKLGTSTDMGFCRSRKKDGTPCRNAVNINSCPFCDYHVQSEYNKIRSKRTECKDSRLHRAFHHADGSHLGTSGRPRMSEGGDIVYVKSPTMQPRTQQQLQQTAERARKHIPGASRLLAAMIPGQSATPQRHPHAAAAAAPRQYGPNGGSHAKHSRLSSSQRPQHLHASSPSLQSPSHNPACNLSSQALLKASGQHTGLKPLAHARPQSNMRQGAEPKGNPGGQQGSGRVVGTVRAGPRAEEIGGPADDGAQELMLQEDEVDWGGSGKGLGDPVLQHALAVIRAKDPNRPFLSRPTPTPPRAAADTTSTHAGASRQSSSGHQRLATTVQQANQYRSDAAVTGSHTGPGLRMSATGGAVGAGLVNKGGRAGPQDRVLAKLGLSSAGHALKAGQQASSALQSTAPPSGFAAAFGSIRTSQNAEHSNTRYKDLVDDEDHERLTRVLTALEKKDEMQQRMEAITKSIPFFRQLNT